MTEAEKQKEYIEISRHLDTQLWAIPAAFFVVISFVLEKINVRTFETGFNAIVFLVAAVLSYLALVWFNKIHCQQLLLSKKLGEELEGWFSPSPERFEFEEIHKDLRKKDSLFYRVQWHMAKRSVSELTIWIMIIFTCANSLFGLYILLYKLIQMFKCL